MDNIRLEELTAIIENLDDNVKKIASPLVGELVFIESKLKEFKKYPFLRVSKSNPNIQEITSAGKLYKEYMQSYDNNLKILLKLVNGNGSDGDDDFDKMMEEFD